ncbi:hypothetical protein UPYG_G00078640, partial [Umbra pygmaea]
GRVACSFSWVSSELALSTRHSCPLSVYYQNKHLLSANHTVGLAMDIDELDRFSMKRRRTRRYLIILCVGVLVLLVILPISFGVIYNYTDESIKKTIINRCQSFIQNNRNSRPSVSQTSPGDPQPSNNNEPAYLNQAAKAS